MVSPTLNVFDDIAAKTAPEIALPAPRDRRGRSRKDYAHCEPWFADLAALPAGHPHRERLRERLILEFLPVADTIAHRFRGRGQARADLVQVARVGLVNAVDRFIPGQVPFLGYAVPTMMGEVRRFFRDTSWATHVPRGMKDVRDRIVKAATELSSTLGRAPKPTELAERLGLDVETVREGLLAASCYQTSSLDQPVHDSDRADAVGGLDPRLELIDDRHTVIPALATLPERERTIIRMRFFDELTQSQIALRLGISQMHVSRLLAKTLRELRDHVGSAPRS